MKSVIQISLFALLLTGAAICNAQNTTAEEKPSMHDSIYHFQHRLLPKWTHHSDGMFYKNLLNKKYDRFMKTASTIVGEKFANNINIQKRKDGSGILLEFPSPAESPECYFVFITKTDGDYRYFTYEKSDDLFNTGIKGVIGEWSHKGTHFNLGSHKFEDADSFIREIKKIVT
jgi:hypothetical protein